MVSKEVLCTVEYERPREARPYGLIDTSRIDDFRIKYIDECEFPVLDAAFDNLCARTGQGYAEFDGDTIRLDSRHEQGGSWVRSISTLQSIEDGLQTWRCVSRVDDYETGTHLLVVHQFQEDSNGHISEPEIGDSSVVPGEHTDLMKHFRVAEEAKPIPVVLSQSA